MTILMGVVWMVLLTVAYAWGFWNGRRSIRRKVAEFEPWGPGY